MEYNKTSPDPLDSETIGKAFLSYICIIDFEVYRPSDDLPAKYKTKRLKQQNKLIGEKISTFFSLAEAMMLQKAKEYDPELLESLAEDDKYGLLKTAAKAVKSSSHYKIGTTVIRTYNAYRKERGKRPLNPKVLPERLLKGLESLV